MPRSSSGTWVEYTVPTLVDEAGATIVRTFGSEVSSLRSAVENGNKVTRVQFGETLAEALTRQATDPEPTPRSRTRAAARQGAAELPGVEA